MMRNIILSHERNTQSSNKSVTIRIKKVQLLHEIADYGYIEGEMIDNTLADAKRETQDIVQANNSARIVRILDLAYTKVVRFLSPLTDNTLEDGTTLDDVPDKRENYDIVMSVDDTFTKEKLELLRNLIHNYMLWYAIYQWLSITSPDAAVKWKAQVDEVEEDIRDMRFSGGMYLRPYRPF